MNTEFPSNAKKVFEGVIFDAYQWPQELFDGSVKTFEAVTRPSIVAMIAVVNDKILVVEEEQPGYPPYFAIPAGFSEKYDQDELASAKRELMEETGLTSDEWELFDTYELYPRMFVRDYVFIARNCTRTHEKMLDTGVKQHGEYFYTLDEFIELIDHPRFASFFIKHHLILAKYDPEYKVILQKKIFGE